ncbi:MAG: thiamine phosphate synthase [Kofleriaceae bacterium]
MLAAVRVVAITDRRLMGEGPRGFETAIARALRGCAPGSVLVQVREKDLDGGSLLELVRIAGRYAPVSVNDRVDVALAGNAAAVHLPERGMPVVAARALFNGVIGVSRHAPDAKTGADLVQLGPIWPTPSKPDRPLGSAALAASTDGRCIVAVGGIDGPARAREAVAAGADAVAVIRAAWTQDALAAMVAAVDEARVQRP